MLGNGIRRSQPPPIGACEIDGVLMFRGTAACNFKQDLS